MQDAKQQLIDRLQSDQELTNKELYRLLIAYQLQEQIEEITMRKLQLKIKKQEETLKKIQLFEEKWMDKLNDLKKENLKVLTDTHIDIKYSNPPDPTIVEFDDFTKYNPTIEIDAVNEILETKIENLNEPEINQSQTSLDEGSNTIPETVMHIDIHTPSNATTEDNTNPIPAVSMDIIPPRPIQNDIATVSNPEPINGLNPDSIIIPEPEEIDHGFDEDAGLGADFAFF
ncbi:hypothetical protein BC833DRAFT_620839 [Globomyces pollinis-pini]|nr:hypothetical protein BC833DRAFT_620839 [Globomyces pollinis-pini]